MLFRPQSLSFLGAAPPPVTATVAVTLAQPTASIIAEREVVGSIQAILAQPTIMATAKVGGASVLIQVQTANPTIMATADVGASVLIQVQTSKPTVNANLAQSIQGASASIQTGIPTPVFESTAAVGASVLIQSQLPKPTVNAYLTHDERVIIGASLPMPSMTARLSQGVRASVLVSLAQPTPTVTVSLPIGIGVSAYLPFPVAQFSASAKPKQTPQPTLYPITILQPVDAAAGPNPLSPGCIAVIPLDMTATKMTSISLAQLTLTQDFSLRSWVSVYPNGIPVTPPPRDVFPVMKVGGYPLVVHLGSEVPPTDSISIPVTSGRYYVNVLNLTNEWNLFSFSKTDLS